MKLSENRSVTNAQNSGGNSGSQKSSFDPCQQFISLLEHISNVCFFAKNEDSKIIAASKVMVKRFGLESEEQILGKGDHDFFPLHIAEGFIQDDQWVMKNGQPLMDRVEVLFDENRIFDWYAANKFPLYDREGKIVGVMGTTQSMEEKRGAFYANLRVSKAVQKIQADFAEKLSISDLAALSSLNERQFRRQFRKFLGITPMQFRKGLLRKPKAR